MRRREAAEVIVGRLQQQRRGTDTTGKLMAAVDPILSVSVQTPIFVPQTDGFERTQK